MWRDEYISEEASAYNDSRSHYSNSLDLLSSSIGELRSFFIHTNDNLCPNGSELLTAQWA